MFILLEGLWSFICDLLLFYFVPPFLNYSYLGRPLHFFPSLITGGDVPCRQGWVYLAKLCVELLCEVRDKFLHDGVDLLVVHRLLSVLEDEVDSV